MQTVMHVDGADLRRRKSVAYLAEGMQQSDRIRSTAECHTVSDHARHACQRAGKALGRERDARAVHGSAFDFRRVIHRNAQKARRRSPVCCRICDAISSMELPLVSRKRTASLLKIDSASTTSLRHRLREA